MPPPHAHGSGDTLRGVLWGLASAMGSAAFLIPWKVATHHGEGRHLVFVLLTAAALLNSAGLLVFAGRRHLRMSATAIWVAVVLAVLTLVGNEASAAAIARVSGPFLSVLQRFEVVVVGILAWVVLGERMSWPFWIGTLVAATGVVLAQGSSPSAVHTAGVAYGLLASGAFGAMVVVTRRFITKIDPFTVNGLRLWLSVALWLAFHREIPAPADLPPSLILNGTLAALFGPFSSRLFMMYSLRWVAAPISALCILVAPVATLALSWSILGEVPTATEALGGAIILLGVAVPLVAEVRSRR